MQHVALILPAFNEELTISETMEDFHRALPEASIWVVNNRSTDATYEIAVATLKKLACRGGVLDEMRKGKGNAIRCAFTQVEADIYVMVDADLTYSAADVTKLLVPVLSGEADMVVGDRHAQGHYAVENKRAFHGFGNRLMRDLVNRLFRAQLSDILSGYRVFSRRFVKTYPILVEGFEIETDITLHALDKRFSIQEIPVGYRDRPQGSISKLNTLSDGVRVLKTLMNIFRYYRPLAFFGSLAFAFLLLGLVLGFPVLKEWALTRYISHIPMAILASGVEIIAMVLASIGLILDSIQYQNKLIFERELLSYGAFRYESNSQESKGRVH